MIDDLPFSILILIPLFASSISHFPDPSVTLCFPHILPSLKYQKQPATDRATFLLPPFPSKVGEPATCPADAAYESSVKGRDSAPDFFSLHCIALCTDTSYLTTA